MPLRVRPAADAADSFVKGTGGAQKAYQDGVASAGQAWHDGAVNADQTWQSGTAQAAADGRYKKGVERAGVQRYVDKAKTVGAGRYTDGAAKAKNDYQTGVAPYLDVIAAQNLPQRRPKGDQSNIQRVAQIASALRDKKLKG